MGSYAGATDDGAMRDGHFLTLCSPRFTLKVAFLPTLHAAVPARFLACVAVPRSGVGA